MAERSAHSRFDISESNGWLWRDWSESQDLNGCVGEKSEIMIRAMSWNMGGRRECWRPVAESNVDIALLQEARLPPDDVLKCLGVDDAPWQTEGSEAVRNWRAAVVRVNPDLHVGWYRTRSLADCGPSDLRVSRMGTLAAADVTDSESGEVITFVSLYSIWERPHVSTASPWIYADASAHRLISDLSALVGRQRGHRIVAAGDFNILHGYGENGSEYWAERYRTVFDRFRALGLRFVGPQHPNGCQADPWPGELPIGSHNVPTYHTAQQSPVGASRQLDFVFASESIADRVQTRAINEADQWGGSDHCRIAITVGFG